MTIGPFRYTRQDWEEAQSAMRSLAFKGNAVGWILAIMISLGVAQILGPIAQSIVFRTGTFDPCASVGAVVNFAIAGLFAFVMYRKRAVVGSVRRLGTVETATHIVGIFSCLAAIVSSVWVQAITPPEPPVQPRPGANPFLPMIPWLVTFVVLWVNFLRIFRSGASSWNRQPNTCFPDQVEYDPVAICFRNEVSERRYTWHSMVGWHESANLFLIYRSYVTAEMIPKRAFVDQFSMDQFRGVLVACIPQTDMPTGDALSASPPPLPAQPSSGNVG